MEIKLINIGFGNIVSANRIISIVSPESAPIKRIIQEARERGMLIDATYGKGFCFKIHFLFLVIVLPAVIFGVEGNFFHLAA